MKRKWLLLSLAPLALASCGGAVSSTFEAIRDKIGALPSSASYPYYRVVGMMDFNNEILEVEQTFKEAPIDGEFVPYARYNEGFYNAAMDGVEPNPADILIYGMASRSYWLRAPLRLTADNFYKTIALDRGSGTFDGLAFDVNYSTGQIGTIGDEITGARLAKVDDSHVSLTYMKGEEQTVLNFARSGEGDPEAFYAGKWVSGDHELDLTQGTRENRTCGHYIISHLVTSYMDLDGSANPSKSVMRYQELDDGGFVFYGKAVHTNVRVDNYPYYPDYNAHPELGYWDEDDPTPCYKNTVNAKVNIRFEYDADGWLRKEEMTSLGYSYKTATDAQISLVAEYYYKFA